MNKLTTNYQDFSGKEGWLRFCFAYRKRHWAEDHRFSGQEIIIEICRMAHNEQLTNRVREALAHLPYVEEKKMFRGICFMVDGKMCMSTGNEELMCRIDPALHDQVMEKNGVRAMVMKGRTYPGYVYVHEDALKRSKDFNYLVQLALDFNPHAKAAPKKKKKTDV